MVMLQYEHDEEISIVIRVSSFAYDAFVIIIMKLANVLLAY